MRHDKMPEAALGIRCGVARTQDRQVNAARAPRIGRSGGARASGGLAGGATRRLNGG